MDLSKLKIGSLATLVALAVSGLIGIQYLIVKKDLEINEDQMDLSIPAMLMEFNDQLDYNRPLAQALNDYDGETVDFNITNSFVPSNSIEEHLKYEWDKVLNLNYPEMQYDMAVFLTGDYGCIFHAQHSKGLPKKAEVVMGDNHLCLCRLSRTTLDIRLTSTNKSTVVLNQSAPIFLVSLVLILIISLAFVYTIRTIGKQKKLSKMKNDFINNMTHEFKTPIFSISLASKTLSKLKEIEGKSDLEKYLNVIDTETSRLKNQVDKVLQMSLIDSVNLALEQQQINIHLLIEEVVKSFEVSVNDRGGNITCQLQAKNAVVNLDETHVKNVIYNLLDNAVKYAKENPYVELESINTANNFVLSIKDHGIGMSEETQRMAFDKFYREQMGDLHAVKGHGLGLSYVKGIVEAHGGRISVTSKKGKGTNFILTFPLA